MGVFALNPEKVYSSGNYSGRALHYLLPKIAFLRHGRSSKNLEMVHFEGICKNTQYRGIYRNGLPIRADLHWPDGRRRGGDRCYGRTRRDRGVRKRARHPRGQISWNPEIDFPDAAPLQLVVWGGC
jgi:hypothetical protein